MQVIKEFLILDYVFVWMDIRRIVIDNVLIANQKRVYWYFNVNIKIHKIKYGLMVNSVMMAILILEMAVIIR